MNIDEIITFLEVVELQSISAAANQLFISQSSASNRINHLENSLGTKLIHRAKGYKKISLTEEGEYFLPIAQQWMALYNDVKNITNLHHAKTFKITTNSILNSFLLPYIYTDFSNKYKNIMIHSQTEHSTEAHQHIANQTADLAIVYTEHYEPNVISKPLFKENMVFICHKDSRFAKTQLLSDLCDANEVYAKWSSEFENWHQRQFPYFHRHKIVIGSAIMFDQFLIEQDDWAIVSRIVGDNIHLTKPDFITIDQPYLPIRTAYLLSHKYPKPGSKKLNMLFIDELLYHLKNNPSVDIIENM
ncbi:LysR family transcriptional regulator [Breznakia pachnodae]|uniref:DNA-binding transcriptional LysR family regulator n=1 Tax=Breznakia pachnodae TaxID=265178 RepID=A0ABU0E0Q1_9FIRM|nr:LysR family transcriptional regulator [Breznakia pachnodae]MDQ0360462.1 DNA-binding transcriptional LysR family regulator [Breznakia pachnodae]